MKKINRTHVIYQMSAENQPSAFIEPGETITVETYDCYQGQLLPEGSSFKNFDRRFGNPATGPICINGAKPGDLLKITIQKIALGPVGILDIGPNSGAMKEYFPEPVIRRIPVEDGTLTYCGTNGRDVKIPVKPMIGVIGTAPSKAAGAVSTMTPMDHGGNMDCTRICEGSILYLPVFTEGGLLALGDFHAIMGDGEVGNCGVEIEGEAELTIDLIHGTDNTSPVISFPLIENSEQWITVAYGETLDLASEKAVKQMFQFLTGHQNLSPADAGMLIDMLGDLIVCQIVNPMKTARMEVPKWAIKQLQPTSAH